MYAPRDPISDDDDDNDDPDDDHDDDDGGDSHSSASQFIDMSSIRLVRRRNLGLRFRVRMHRSCDT